MRIHRPIRWRACAAALFLASSAAGAVMGMGAAAGTAAAQPAPEGSTGRRLPQAAATASRSMVAAANPLAAETGRAILRAGGSAVDAAIAVQLVLNLVEPQSSGIGGGAFLVHYEAATGTVTSYDGRETAPAAAVPGRFLRPDGTPMDLMEAIPGGRSVGVPGTVRLLELAHAAHGRLPWPALFERAIRLATDGFPISPRLNGLLGQETILPRNDAARAYFYQPDGTPKPVGRILKNPDFAATLGAIAKDGARAFYEGPIAADIVAAVRGHSANPGDLGLDDLKAYRAVERDPVCGRYRAYRLCGMGPPSSGPVAVLQTLAMLEGRVDAQAMAATERDRALAAHWLAEAGRLAFADRGLYLADPDFVKVPVRGLLDPGYLRGRAALIGGRSMGRAEPGDPPYRETRDWGLAEAAEQGTSHISVVDAGGNAVSMTTTIESGFGSRLMVRGFLLNNELTDFAFTPSDGGKPVANGIEPGKRPRSTMAPMLVFRDGEGGEGKGNAGGALVAVVGSPGGSAIAGYVAKTLVALLDWRMDPQEAVDVPNFGSRNGPTELERGTEAEGWAAALEARGHRVELMEMTSGTQAILVTPDGLSGGADSRREGVAVGD